MTQNPLPLYIKLHLSKKTTPLLYSPATKLFIMINLPVDTRGTAW